MQDPMELIAAGVAGLLEQSAHELPDVVLLTSTSSIFTVINQLHGVAAARLQAMEVREVTTALCGRQTRAWLVEEQHLGHETPHGT